jgi:UDP-N-acetylmuramate--alanine ligase
MEIIRTSENNNILMSDYGHHPTEIRLTLDAIKEKYPDRHLYTIFQPHQYSRTIELLDQFARCFSSADTLVIPNIYESRDTAEDKANMSVEKLIQAIEHPEIINGKDLENTLI